MTDELIFKQFSDIVSCITTDIKTQNSAIFLHHKEFFQTDREKRRWSPVMYSAD